MSMQNSQSVSSPMTQVHSMPIHNNIPIQNKDNTDPLRTMLLSKQNQVSNVLSAVLKKTDPGFAEMLISTFYLTIMRDNKLRNTSSTSMVRALYFCAEKALLPISGKIWLIPFKGECTPIIGVQGYRELIRRNPRVIRLEANIVREKDSFTYISGTNPRIDHVPDISEPCEIIGAYAYAEIKGSAHCTIRFCNKDDIEKSRAESKSAKNEGSIWQKYPEEMTRLIPLRKLAKELIVEKEITHPEEVYIDYNNDNDLTQYSDN